MATQRSWNSGLVYAQPTFRNNVIALQTKETYIPWNIDTIAAITENICEVFVIENPTFTTPPTWSSETDVVEIYTNSGIGGDENPVTGGNVLFSSPCFVQALQFSVGLRIPKGAVISIAIEPLEDDKASVVNLSVNWVENPESS